MKKSIFVLAILLLAGLFLSACEGNSEGEKNVLPELQLQPYKEEAKANLAAYVEALDPDDYSEENWAAIESIANTGKENIDKAADKQGVDSALAAALDEIGLIDKEHRDFILTISAEETTVMQGENFTVNVELKNNSGKDHVINYDYLFWPFIPGWHIIDERQDIPTPPTVMHSTSRLFETGSILRNIETGGFKSGPRILGNTLTLGTHELRFKTMFSLNWGKEDHQLIEVWSNPIMLTVQ